MSDEWLEARSLDDIEAHRDQMLSCSLGTDIDHNDMIEEMEISIEDPTEIEARWFDHCVDSLRRAFAGGSAILYRAVAVDDIDAFIDATANGSPLGVCWTWDKACATTCLHGGEWKEHDILLIAEVPAGAVDWPTTFQQHFAHPCEREVRVYGKVVLTGVVDMSSDDALPWDRREVSC